MEIFQKDKLIIKMFPSRRLVGETAAAEASAAIRELLNSKEQIRMIFAAAPSQNEFLEILSNDKTVDFRRIVAFHMDEYVGLPVAVPQGFGNFLRTKLFGKCPFKKVHYINGLAENLEAECDRYSELLNQESMDILCMGVGENAHIAFNDPEVADFHDPKTVKVVSLDIASRQQQVNDGCFGHVDQVPTSALTLTIPCLFNCKRVFCMVPAKTKANAVYFSLDSDINEKYPASILRNHKNAVMYVDKDSGARLKEVRSIEKI